MSLVNVQIDTKALSQWASELSERGFRNALRRAIDQSARAARKVAIDAIAKDIGVSKAKIRAATPKVITTKAGDLSARWTVTKLRINILDTAGATISRSGGLQASTHRLTGGGSSHLDVSKAFLVTTASGGRFVAYRRGKERLPIKGIYNLDTDGQPRACNATSRRESKGVRQRRLVTEHPGHGGLNTNPSAVCCRHAASRVQSARRVYFRQRGTTRARPIPIQCAATLRIGWAHHRCALYQTNDQVRLNAASSALVLKSCLPFHPERTRLR